MPITKSLSNYEAGTVKICRISKACQGRWDISVVDLIHLLLSTCEDLGQDDVLQGAGLVRMEAAL